MTDQKQYRIFVSYVHNDDDQKRMRLICKHLRELGMSPIVDSDLTPGQAFTAEIQHMIASSHLFLSLLTKNSAQSTWVHQEMGYAMAMHVPVLTLAFDDGDPGSSGMARELHALSVSGDDMSVLTGPMLTHRIESAYDDSQAPCVCTQTVLQRTDRIQKYSREILSSFGAQRIRQSASFSSFSLPDKYPSHPLFKQRNPNFGNNFCALARKERRVLEEHAREEGCSLLLDFYVPADGKSGAVLKHDPERLRPRLAILSEFLESMPDEKVTVVICKGTLRSVLFTVGDMLLVEAPIPLGRKEYNHSVFSWHAPTVARRIKEFDDELMDRLNDLDIAPDQSRQWALGEIETLLKSID